MKKNQAKSSKLRIFAIYELIISAVVIISTFNFFFHISDFLSEGYWGSTILVALLGIIAGIFLIRNKRVGLYLSMTWAFLQIFNLSIKGWIIDLTQILTINITLNLRPAYDLILVLNLFGILLLILLLIWRREID